MTLWKLWLAYGVAIFFTVIAVCIGLAAMLVNGSSYSNSFSTIVRAARGAEITVTIQEDDLDGKDVLPQYLKEAEIRFRSARKWDKLNDYEESNLARG